MGKSNIIINLASRTQSAGCHPRIAHAFPPGHGRVWMVRTLAWEPSNSSPLKVLLVNCGSDITCQTWDGCDLNECTRKSLAGTQRPCCLVTLVQKERALQGLIICGEFQRKGHITGEERTNICSISLEVRKGKPWEPCKTHRLRDKPCGFAWADVIPDISM